MRTTVESVNLYQIKQARLTYKFLCQCKLSGQKSFREPLSKLLETRRPSQVEDIRISVTTLIVGVPNVVDPNPNGEQGSFGSPRSASWLAREISQERIYLVCQGLDRGNVGWNKSAVDGCTSVREVVGVYQGLVINSRIHVNPVCTSDNRATLKNG